MLTSVASTAGGASGAACAGETSGAGSAAVAGASSAAGGASRAACAGETGCPSDACEQCRCIQNVWCQMFLLRVIGSLGGT